MKVFNPGYFVILPGSFAAAPARPCASETLLQASGVAIITGPIDLIPGMFKFLTIRSELLEFGAVSLCQDCVARIAIIGLNCPLPVRSLMLSIVTSETSRPIFVAGVFRVDLPTGLHFREEIIRIDLLRDVDCLPDPAIARVMF